MAPIGEDDTQRQPVLLRAAGLSDWADQLPFANAQACLDEMVAALGAIGRGKLKPARRAELLEILTSAYNRLFESVFPPPHGAGIANFDARRQMLLAAAVRVTSLMAAGYERVLTDLIGASTLWFGSKKLHALALQRAVLFNALTELEIYAGYRSPPPALKARMMVLHEETLHSKDARQEPPAGNLREDFHKPAAHLHLRTVLASIVDPHRVGPNEIWRLFELLGPYADSAVLHLGKPPASKPESVFVMDPKGKKRVLPLASMKPEDVPEGAWYLDANPVLDQIGMQLKSLRARDAGANDPFRWEGRDVILLARAQTAFSGAMERESPRERNSQPVELAFGVTACHFGMSGPPVDAEKAASAAPPPPPPPDEESDQDSMMMIDPRTGGTVDVAYERGRRKAEAEPASDAAAEDKARPGPATGTNYRIDEWLTIDWTSRGLGVRSHDMGKRIAIGVGELVGIQLRSHRRALGIVRWLSIDDEGHYRAGIQYLDGLPEPVAVREVDPKHGRPGMRRPGIALLPNRRIRTPSLIALLGTQQKSHQFVLERGGSQGPLRIRTVSMMDRTQYFERLGFEIDKAPG